MYFSIQMLNYIYFHKKKKTYFFLLLIFTLILHSCASLPPATNTYVKRYCVGKGGGFTGDYTEFSFSEDGKVYKRDFVYERDVYYKDLPPLDLEYFLQKINSLGIQSAELNTPGNMSKYIEIRENETSINKLVWGANNFYAPKEITSLFEELYQKLSERP